ncbi:MAG: hypothetical protein LBR07_04830, partial [Puniceicoccales bacterium]|nr:hypothetical protein [Puniceicoccales bacterium]
MSLLVSAQKSLRKPVRKFLSAAAATGAFASFAGLAGFAGTGAFVAALALAPNVSAAGITVTIPTDTAGNTRPAGTLVPSNTTLTLAQVSDDSANTIVVATGACLWANNSGNRTTFAAALSFSGGGQDSGGTYGALRAETTVNLNGPVTIAAARHGTAEHSTTFSGYNASGTVIINGKLSGTAELSNSGGNVSTSHTRKIVLTNSDNDFTGDVRNTNNTAVHIIQIGDDAGTSGGQLRGAGNFYLGTGNASNRLIINRNKGTGGDDGAVELKYAIQGGGGVTQKGTGTTTLSGTSTYTGPTEVTGGVLRVTGLLGNGNYTGAMTISTGARLVLANTGAVQQFNGVWTGIAGDLELERGANVEFLMDGSGKWNGSWAGTLRIGRDAHLRFYGGDLFGSWPGAFQFTTHIAPGGSYETHNPSHGWNIGKTFLTAGSIVSNQSAGNGALTGDITACALTAAAIAADPTLAGLTPGTADAPTESRISGDYAAHLGSASVNTTITFIVEENARLIVSAPLTGRAGGSVRQANSGSGDLVKRGPGEMRITNYTGLAHVFKVLEGTLVVGDGPDGGGNLGGMVLYTAAMTGNPLSNSNDATFTGTVSIGRGATLVFNQNTAQKQTIANAVTTDTSVAGDAPARLVKRGANTLVLASGAVLGHLANTGGGNLEITGATLLDTLELGDGTLAIGANADGVAAGVAVATGGELVIGGETAGGDADVTARVTTTGGANLTVESGAKVVVNLGAAGTRTVLEVTEGASVVLPEGGGLSVVFPAAFASDAVSAPRFGGVTFRGL